MKRFLPLDSNLIISTNPMEGVAEISLNRTAKRNALTIALVNELRERLNAIKYDSSIRVVVIKGEGKGFCSGMDLSEAMESSLAEESAETLKSLFIELYTFPKITIASVHGFAIAGGCGIVSACDLVIASKDAKFGFPEVKRGLVPALVSVFVTKQLLDKHVRKLFLLGELIDAKEAQNFGIVTKCVDKKVLEKETLEFAILALQSAPEVVSAIKKQLAQTIEAELEEALLVNKKMRFSEEAKEGMSAFFQKRRPNWCR